MDPKNRENAALGGAWGLSNAFQTMKESRQGAGNRKAKAAFEVEK